MRTWAMTKLEEVLIQDKAYVHKLEPIQYKKLSVKLFGRGVVLDESINGMDVKMTKHQFAKAGQVILSEIWGKKGAIGIVPKEGEGALCTSHFFLFDFNEERILSSFFELFLLDNSLEKQLFQKAQGTTGYAATRPKDFLNAEIPLPPLAEQHRLVSRLNAIREQVAAVQILRGRQEQAWRDLQFSVYRELLSKATLQPMREVCPLIRRPIDISEEAAYPEVGIRSFGKGTFAKPALSGFDVGTKRLYEIKERDLLFSNVFAWEGAIAVATLEDDGKFGSHRFITCRADFEAVLPEFLKFHFLTPEGLEQIKQASPGGAGRNRTLGLEKLERILVPIPPIEAQKRFLELLEQSHAARERVQAQSHCLNGLLPSLLSEIF